MRMNAKSNRSVIVEVSSYISGSSETKLPEEVIWKAKYHILDTLAAIVSGSRLKPGQVARKYVESQSRADEAQVIGSPIVTSTINAALANGVMAHADETDDIIPGPNIHPGAAVIPAALSVSEKNEVDGISFLKAVVIGYDIGCRILQALGPDDLRRGGRCTQSFGGCFGAAAACASVLRLPEDSVRYVLSYAAQQASGVLYWPRDEEHIEKGFLFGGMPARNGVTAATLVQSGFTGVFDPFSGESNFFECTSPASNPDLLLEGLGSDYSIMLAYIKRFSVGGPAQAPLDALLLLMEKYGFTARDVQNIVAYLPGGRIVSNRSMPDINLQYLLAVTLLDGNLTFEAAHSYKRMTDPAVLDIRKRVNLVEDPELSTDKHRRQGIVEVLTKDGTTFKEHVLSVRGTPENPMTKEEVERKCRDLLVPVLGKDRTEKLIDRIWNLERVSDIRQLRPLLSA